MNFMIIDEKNKNDDIFIKYKHMDNYEKVNFLRFLLNSYHLHFTL